MDLLDHDVYLRALADIDYLLREPLGWHEGAAVVWAGMRGAVTVAAAQTLPDDTPQRSVLVLVAFTVAAMSLLVQGGTIGPLLRLVRPPAAGPGTEEHASAERTQIMELLRAGTETIAEPVLPEDTPRMTRFEVARTYRMEVLAAQRSALLDARDHGTFDADMLADFLATIDADQIAIEMRGEIAG